MYLKDYSFLYIPSNEKMLYYIILFVWKEKDLELIWFNFKPILKNSNWNGFFGCIKMFYVHMYLKGYSFMYIHLFEKMVHYFILIVWKEKDCGVTWCLIALVEEFLPFDLTQTQSILFCFLNLDSMKLSLEAVHWKHPWFDYILRKII